ncbi:hypothetical protein M0813_22722 [Anaeramoeba flamelloides]|uniref:Reverse transcriptase domain-containing protein n=1 Tax=Anaeramoeba flamelloides TaxID=1746091 RepID=A0ABQ8YCH9_9EUKA|nr:hypothetical protein M0813_22722 [Anaeramoeba flamelloides]
MFADDLILIIKGNKIQINQKLNSIYEIIIQFGLKPNKDKTVISKDLKKIKYLGIYLDKIAHIVYNLKKSKETYNNCKQLFNNNSLNNSLKIRLFKSFILSQLTYGLEIFNYQITTINYLNSWINSCITEICKINRNTPILIYKTEFKIENMVISVNKKKFKLKNKLGNLTLPYLEKLIKFNQRINNKINWYSKDLKELKNEIYKYTSNELLNSKSWKVQNYFTIIKNQKYLFKTQKYLSYPSSSTILKFRSFTNCLNRYYYVINKNSNKFCPLCSKYEQKEIIENIDHFLWVCPSYKKDRLMFYNKLKEINLNELISNQDSFKLFSLINNREIYDFTLKFLKGNLSLRATRVKKPYRINTGRQRNNKIGKKSEKNGKEKTEEKKKEKENQMKKKGRKANEKERKSEKKEEFDPELNCKTK